MASLAKDGAWPRPAPPTWPVAGLNHEQLGKRQFFPGLWRLRGSGACQCHLASQVATRGLIGEQRLREYLGEIPRQYFIGEWHSAGWKRSRI